MKIIRSIKNKWNMMQPDNQVVSVLAFLYALIVIVILVLGLYVKIWE